MRKVITVVAVGAVLAMLNCFFIVRESQTALVTQFGRIERTGFAPGLHFKLPVVQQVVRFDKRVLTLESAPERYLTSERKDVNIDFFVKWRIADASKFYTSVAGDQSRAEQRLGPIIKEGLRTAVNTRTLQKLVSMGRSDLTQPIVISANRATLGLGIEVVDLRLKRIDLPEDGTVIGSVYERMRSERVKVANQLRAEGSEAAKTIRADAEREALVLNAEAYRDAQKIRGEGDAEASILYATAYEKNADFYAFYRSLEAYRQAFSKPNGVLVLDQNSEFMRYLKNSQ